MNKKQIAISFLKEALKEVEQSEDIAIDCQISNVTKGFDRFTMELDIYNTVFIDKNDANAIPVEKLGIEHEVPTNSEHERKKLMNYLDNIKFD